MLILKNLNSSKASVVALLKSGSGSIPRQRRNLSRPWKTLGEIERRYIYIYLEFAGTKLVFRDLSGGRIKIHRTKFSAQSEPMSTAPFPSKAAETSWLFARFNGVRGLFIGNPHYGFKALLLSSNSSFPLFYIQPLRETTTVIDTPPLPSLDRIRGLYGPIILFLEQYSCVGFLFLVLRKKKKRDKNSKLLLRRSNNSSMEERCCLLSEEWNSARMIAKASSRGWI